MPQPDGQSEIFASQLPIHERKNFKGNIRIEKTDYLFKYKRRCKLVLKSRYLPIIAAVIATTLIFSGTHVADAASPKHQYGSKTITKMQNTEFINAAKRVALPDVSDKVIEQKTTKVDQKFTPYSSIKQEQLKNNIKSAEQQKAQELISKLYNRLYQNLNF